MTRLAPAFVLAGVALVGAAGAASAAGHHDKPATGHTPIVVCHNVTHNPHIIVVDDDSTKMHAHLAHRTQAQLMDLVEGYDGTAAQIRALCVPKPAPSPTSIPTTTPTEVPSSTTTTTTPSTTTQTSKPSTPPTSATSQPTSPSPTSSTSATQPSVPTVTVTTGTPSHSTKPSTAPTTTRSAPTGDSLSPLTRSTSSGIPSHASPRRSVPSSTVAPPEQLAYTGSSVGFLLAVAGVLLVLGVLAYIALREKGTHR